LATGVQPVTCREPESTGGGEGERRLDLVGAAADVDDDVVELRSRGEPSADRGLRLTERGKRVGDRAEGRCAGRRRGGLHPILLNGQGEPGVESFERGGGGPTAGLSGSAELQDFFQQIRDEHKHPPSSIVDSATRLPSGLALFNKREYRDEHLFVLNDPLRRAVKALALGSDTLLDSSEPPQGPHGRSR
jgi:hypothetical protein